MKRIITLTENDLTRIVKKVLLTESQCKNTWYWPDYENNKETPCWGNQDLLSCELRKYLGKELDFGMDWCGGYALPCPTTKLKSPCGLGKVGNSIPNPNLTKNWKRRELIYVVPTSLNVYTIAVEVFKERTEIIKMLEGLMGKKILSGSSDDYGDLSGFRFGNKDGCYVFYKENISDGEVKTIIERLRNQLSIPFGTTELGVTNVQNVKSGEGKPTQTISSKIINTNNTNTGKEYNFKEVQTDFGVKPYDNSKSKDSSENKENFNDNLKLQKAWDSGWRPGDVIPDNLQTNTYKSSKGNVDSDLNLPTSDSNKGTEQGIQFQMSGGL
jgi:hypothetical protein